MSPVRLLVEEVLELFIIGRICGCGGAGCVSDTVCLLGAARVGHVKLAELVVVVLVVVVVVISKVGAVVDVVELVVLVVKLV